MRYRFEAQPKGAAVGGQSGWMNGSYNPTDLYYANLVKFATLFDDWDLDGNGKYNRSTWAVDPYQAKQNPDDVTGYPDVALGRLLASAADEVTLYVQKLKAYEKRALHGGRGGAREVTFLADIAYPGSQELSQDVIKASGGIAAGNTVKRIALESGMKPPAAPWKAGAPPTSTMPCPTLGGSRTSDTAEVDLGRGRRRVRRRPRARAARERHPTDRLRLRLPDGSVHKLATRRRVRGEGREALVLVLRGQGKRQGQ